MEHRADAITFRTSPISQATSSRLGPLDKVMRFSLETLFGAVTLCAIEAALVASRSPWATLPAALLGAFILYVPLIWVCNQLNVGSRQRSALLALSGGMVAAIVLGGVAYSMYSRR